MVNGSTSRIIYVGAYVLIALSVIGEIVLSALRVGSPPILDTVIVSLMAFIAGAHIKPPVTMLYPDDTTAQPHETKPV